MTSKESGLTGLALVLLAYWELGIREIPLGIFAIRYEENPELFTGIICLKLILAAGLLARSLIWWHRRYQCNVARPGYSHNY